MFELVLHVAPNMRFTEIVKEYLINSTFHGVKFIADDSYHVTERYYYLLHVLNVIVHYNDA